MVNLGIFGAEFFIDRNRYV